MRRSAVGAAACLFLAAGHALAGVPEALDRVPDDVVLVATIGQLDDFVAKAKNLTTQLGIQDMDEQFGMAEMLLNTAGLDRDGSVALALMPGPDGGFDPDAEDGPLVMVVPVTDYAAFVGSFGGEAGGVSTLDAMGATLYARDLGGGWAAMGPMKDVIAGFEGTPGNAAKHEQSLGASGNSVAEGCDSFVIANMEALRPFLSEQVDGYKQSMQMMAMMAGPQANMEGQIAMMSALADGFINDAETSIIGLGFEDTGVALDAAAQFSDGSEMAGYFSGKGNAQKMMGKVPDLPFLFAFSADTSAPGLKSFMTKLKDISEKAAPDAPEGIDPFAMAQNSNGWAAVMGSPPGLMGGLFANTSMYFNTSNPADFVGGMSKAVNALNGVEQNGVTWDTTYAAGGAQVDGKSVDSWTARMKFDPNNPSAAQMQMGMGMIWGPSMGPSGYIAKAGDGVVMTMSQNSPLMAQALKSADTGGGLGSSAALAKVRNHLPEGRSVEGFIGFGAILEQVGSVMAMMGQPLPFEVPNNLTPIGMGATTDGGGARFKLFMPNDVLETIAELSAAGEDQWEEDDDWDEEEEDPRF